MAGVNKVILVGRLGKDVELKYTANNDAIANFSIATSENWTDKQGQKQEKTEWHNISMFGKMAEIANQYLSKGSQVYIEGKLQTRKWQDNTGADRYTTSVVVSGFDGKMQMLGARGDNNSSGNYNNEAQQNQASAPQQAPAKQDPITPVETNDGFEDDIPF